MRAFFKLTTEAIQTSNRQCQNNAINLKQHSLVEQGVRSGQPQRRLQVFTPTAHAHKT